MQGETMKNIAHKLKCITESGYYQFNLNSRKVRRGEEIELVYLHFSDSAVVNQETEVTLKKPHDHIAHLERSQQISQMSEAQWQRWKQDKIDDFVRQLGFLDSEVADREKINSFLHQNEVILGLGTL